MLNFKRLKDKLIKEFILEDSDDLAELSAFSHGLDVMQSLQFDYIRDLETVLDDLIFERSGEAARNKAKELLKKGKEFKYE